MLTDEEFKCFLKALGTRIRTLRKEKKFNMRDIMIATGYYDAQWRKYEAGGSMNLMSLMKVALALEVSLVELLDGLGEWPIRSVAEIESVSGSAERNDQDNSNNDVSVESELAPKAAQTSQKPARAKTVKPSKADGPARGTGGQRPGKFAT